MLATCICLNGSLLDQFSCTIVYLHNLFTCTFGRINMSVCLSVCLSVVDECPFIPQEKANLSHGLTKLMIHNQQSVMVWKGEILLGHCVAQMKF